MRWRIRLGSMAMMCCTEGMSEASVLGISCRTLGRLCRTFSGTQMRQFLSTQGVFSVGSCGIAFRGVEVF